MRRARSSWLLLVPLLAAPALRADLGDPIRGQSLFVAKKCVQCHAVRGAGGRTGPDLGRTAVKGSFFEIASGMWNHTRTMGEKMAELRLTRPTFQEDELADLLAFLYFLNYFDEPGDPSVGKVLFAEKHCIQCHGVGRTGGVMGPRLDSLPRGTPPLRIAQDLWNHGPAMVPAIRRMGLEVPKFQGNQILDLFAYMRSQGQRRAVRDFRTAGDAARGKKLFTSKGCARCHEVFGTAGGIGPDLGRSELKGSVTQLAGRMWNHWPAMSEAMGALGMAPPTFEGEELADVFAYLFVTRYDGRPGEAERGRAVYREKGCVVCHGETGTGGSAPALGAVRGETKERIVQRMWNHAPRMWNRMGEHRIPWPHFDAAELNALLTALSGGWKDASATGTGASARRAP